MKVLVVGTGGVGSAVAAVAQRRDFFERMVFADLDPARPQALVERLGDPAVRAPRRSTPRTRRRRRPRARARRRVLNAADPRFNPPIFEAAFEAGCTYLDMAMTLLGPERPTTLLGRRAVRAGRALAGARACSRSSGSASSPACPTSSPATRPTTCSPRSTRSAVRDGADLVVEGYDFAPTFSIWTTIEECLNPPLVWERDRGWFTTEPFSRAGGVRLPRGDRRRRVRERRARGGRCSSRAGSTAAA